MHKFICKKCGKEFWGYGNRKYCSKICAGTIVGSKLCIFCGREFKSIDNQKRNKYCSSHCFSEDRKQYCTVTLICCQCGNSYEVKRHETKRSKYCSTRCASSARKLDKSFTCMYCGKVSEPNSGRFRIKPHKFCSPACSRQYKKEEHINADGTKTCIICKKAKPLTEFYTGGSHATRKCISCISKLRSETYMSQAEEINKKRRQKYINNPDILRARRLKRAFNMTLEDYDNMFKKQGGVCVICGKPPEGIDKRGKTERPRKLEVDHNHKTGKVRGLLCFHCNNGLGCFKDSKENLASAIKYLEETDGVVVNSYPPLPAGDKIFKIRANNPGLCPPAA